jgi:formyl-CoA transferase
MNEQRSQQDNRPLSGVKVIETAQVITGPMAGLLLAEMGADVIKVEQPPRGDAFRHWRGDGAGSVPASFVAFNRGKRSVGLDTKTEEGRDMYRSLVRSADVVIENYRPGVMDKAGLGWEQLRKLNPSLIYCHITGMGTSGPRAGLPTYDAVAQALSGLWSQLTDCSQPEPVGPPFADQLTGLYATVAILAALQARTSTGEGAKVEVDMLSSCLAFQTLAVTSCVIDGTVSDRSTRSRVSLSFGFVDSGGRPFGIHLSGQQKFWEALCRALDLPELIGDPRFRTKADRSTHYDELHDVLQAVFAAQNRDELMALLAAAEVPSAPILSVGEALVDPQVIALDIIGDDGPRSPAVINGHRCAAVRTAPEFGEHTEEVLDSLKKLASDDALPD